MPTTVNAAPPPLEAFAHTASKALKDRDRIIFKNGVLSAEGGGRALFHRVSTRKAALDALQQSVIEKYGEDFANIFSNIPGLKHVLKGPRSLRACHVRDLLQRVDEKAALPLVKALQDMVCPPGEDVKALDANILNGLKDLVHKQIHTLSVEDQEKLKGLGKLPQNEQAGVVAELLEKMPCTVCLRAACGQIPHPSFHDIVLPPQAQADVEAKRLTLNTLDVATLGALASGKGVPPQDGRIIYALMVQKLPDMRLAQPEGPLTAQTVWRTCLQEDAPPDLQRHTGPLAPKMMQRVAEQVAERTGGKPYDGNALTTTVLLGVGVKYDTVLRVADAQRARTPIPSITMDSLGWHEPLEKGMEHVTLESLEKALAGDIHRLSRPAPTFTFEKADVSTDCFPLDTATLSEAELGSYKRGLISPKSQEIMTLVKDMCQTDAQRITVARSLNQGGLYYVKTLGALYGAANAEHFGMNVHISRQREPDRPWEEWESVSVRQSSPLESPLEVHFEYTVDKNGTSALSSFAIGQRAQVKSSKIALPREGLSHEALNESITQLRCSDAYKGKLRDLLTSAQHPEKMSAHWGRGFAIAQAFENRYEDFLNSVPPRLDGDDKTKADRELSQAWLPILDDVVPCLQGILETEWLKGVSSKDWGADDRTEVFAGFACHLLGNHPELVNALRDAGVTSAGMQNLAFGEAKKAPGAMQSWNILQMLCVICDEMMDTEKAQAPS